MRFLLAFAFSGLAAASFAFSSSGELSIDGQGAALNHVRMGDTYRRVPS